jgi:HD superfamily phosphodiesterase
LTDLNHNINLVENRWLIPTQKHIATLFLDVGLQSHDHLHHLRVWSFAKQLVNSFAKKYKTDYSVDYIEALFFACLFHDTGLIKTKNEEHGNVSVEYAKDYLSNQAQYSNLFIEEAMSAIALHDNKTYFNVVKSPMPGLYEFLTIADDLDAFGALGLMRYFEIYIHRGVELQAIIQKIDANIKSRFEFLASFLEVDQALFKLHSQRYMLSITHLKRFNTKELEIIYQLIMQGSFLPEKRLIPQNPVIYDLIISAKKEGDIYH